MPKVTLQDSGQTLEIPEGKSFLEYCQENDVPYDFGCTVGSCGTCTFVPIEGADSLDAMTDEERETVEMTTDEAGARLGCQLHVRGDLTIRPANV